VDHGRPDELHGRHGDFLDRLLDPPADDRRQRLGDVPHGQQRDVLDRLLHGGVAAEDGDVGLGDDLELHPRDFAHHDAHVVERVLAEAELAADDLQAVFQTQFRRHVVVPVVELALGSEVSAVETDVAARVVEVLRTVGQHAIDVPDMLVEVERGILPGLGSDVPALSFEASLFRVVYQVFIRLFDFRAKGRQGSDTWVQKERKKRRVLLAGIRLFDAIFVRGLAGIRLFDAGIFVRGLP
jgi:hypothetical protein